MHCNVFYIHLAVLQSYLSLFSHITCIHFSILDTQLDLKIDLLIFESCIHFSICYFSWCVKCWKLIFFFFFFGDIIDNNVQIFSLFMQLFRGHIVSSLHLLKERIFFLKCILTLVLSLVFVSFYLSPPIKFSLKLFFSKLVLFFLFL